MGKEKGEQVEVCDWCAAGKDRGGESLGHQVSVRGRGGGGKRGEGRASQGEGQVGGGEGPVFR